MVAGAVFSDTGKMDSVLQTGGKLTSGELGKLDSVLLTGGELDLYVAVKLSLC